MFVKRFEQRLPHSVQYLLNLTTLSHLHLYTPVWELATNSSHLDYCKSPKQPK